MHTQRLTVSFLAPKLFCIATGVFILQRIAHSDPDPDMFGYMSFGRLFWESGFPYQDIFAYSETLPKWIYHEWLTGVVFFPLWELHPSFLQGLRIALIGLLFVFCYIHARNKGASLLHISLIGLLVSPFLSYGYSPLRAQAFTNVLFIATIHYYYIDSKPYALWKTIVAFVGFSVWANMHGGFMVGMAMGAMGCAYRSISSRSFRPSIILALPFIGILLNPYGLDYLHYIHDALSLQRTEIYEWHSIYTAFIQRHSMDVLLHFLVVAAAILLILCMASRQPLYVYLILAITFLAGCKHLRHQAFFYLSVLFFAPPALPSAWQTFLNKLPAKSKLPLIGKYAAVSVSVYFIVLFILNPPFPKLFQLVPAIYESGSLVKRPYPVGATSWLQSQNASGNIVTEFHWGQYLIWTLSPEFKVGFDGRYETVYTQRTADLFFEFIHRRPNWNDFLDAFPTDYILVGQDNVLRVTLSRDAGWELVFEDAVSALFRHAPE